jgi:hypothetical protein
MRRAVTGLALMLCLGGCSDDEAAENAAGSGGLAGGGASGAGGTSGIGGNGWAGAGGGSCGVEYTTSVGALLANDTPMADEWNTSSTFGHSTWQNHIPPWAPTSGENIAELLYPGSTSAVFMHLMPWWRKGGGGGHRNVGYDSDDAAQVARQMDYLVRHGVHGVMPNWYGKDLQGGYHEGVTRLWRDEGQKRTIDYPDGSSGPFKYAWNYDGGALKMCASEWGQYTTDGNVALSPTRCFDPGDIDAKWAIAALSNADCEAAAFHDPKTFSGTLSADGRAGTTRDEATCYVSKHLLYDFAYSFVNHWQAPNYERRDGRPLVTFFGVDGVQFKLPSALCPSGDCIRNVPIDWDYVNRMADQHFGQPLLVFRQSGGFSHAESDGGFCWIAHGTSDPYSIGQAYLDNFYATGKSAGKIIVGCGHGAFNNLEAPWRSADLITHPRCGRAWLESLSAFNAQFDLQEQAEYLQLNTLNDHEEGSGFEPGIESCWRIDDGAAPALEGNMLVWRLDAVDPDGPCANSSCLGGTDGPERAEDATLETVHHFTLFASDDVPAADGTPRLVVVQDGISPSSDSECLTIDAASRTYRWDLACAKLPAASYRFYVRMVGVAFVHNELSAPSESWSVSDPCR